MRRLGRGACAAALVLLVAAPARGSVFDFVFDTVMSRQMPKMPGDTSQEKTRGVVLNGFPMYLTTGRSSRDIKGVLDYYQEKYQGGALKEIVSKPVGVRREGQTTGTLMSIEVPDRQTAMEIWNGKRTLASAGPLRMVYARRSGLHTDYLIAWTDRAMPMEILQPVQSGDAPGKDIPGVPRPMGGIRTFSFEEPKAGYLIAMYQVGDPVEAALRSAATRVAGTGWEEDVSFGLVARRKGKHVVRFARGDKDLVITARPSRDDERLTQLVYLSRDLS